MTKPKLIDLYTVEHNGVTITIQRRHPGSDYGYKTSSGISGIGQSSESQAESDAKRAIDEKANEAKQW